MISVAPFPTSICDSFNPVYHFKFERKLEESESGYVEINLSCFFKNFFTPGWQPNGLTFELKSIISIDGFLMEYKPPCEAGECLPTNWFTLIFNIWDIYSQYSIVLVALLKEY